MENKAHFGSLTPGMQAYRESVLDQKPYIDARRAVLATEAYKKNLNQPPVMKRALMLQNILAGMDIYIEDETILVGNQSSVNRGAPVFPEYTMKFIMDELDLFEKRDGDVFYITEETKEQLREIAPFWENNNLRARGEALIPEEMQVYMDTGFFGMEGKLNAGDAHLAVDYETLLRTGLRGYEERTRELKAGLDLTEPESIDKYQFYKAVLIVIDSVKKFASRYAALAREKALASEEPRKSELLEIARICEKVPYEPAETFHEAVQSVWFIQLILQIESNGHSLSYGSGASHKSLDQNADDQQGSLAGAYIFQRRKPHVPECHDRRSDCGRQRCSQPAVFPDPQVHRPDETSSAQSDCSLSQEH